LMRSSASWYSAMASSGLEAWSPCVTRSVTSGLL